MNELEALTVLSGIPYLGSVKIRLLLHRFGSATTALEADNEELKTLPGFNERICSNWEAWKKNDEWKRNLDLVDEHGARIVPFTSAEYPQRLLQIHDFPILLYMIGTRLPKDNEGIAVVGTRNASIYGNEMAEKISGDLARMDFTVVSGLARGVDTTAHQAALKYGRTIAVIGSGLANIYPSENKGLGYKIAERGALISEFPMATPPDRQNFPQRNRIVSGMSQGTLLIEAPIKSGAMITMDRAYEQKRKLFAIPGRLDQENFGGNHFLIKSGRAQLVEGAQDIANSFGDLFSSQPVLLKNEEINVPELEEEEKKLLSLLPNEELSIEKIVLLTKLPIMKLNVLLMSLLLKKAVKEFPGKMYKKLVIY